MGLRVVLKIYKILKYSKLISQRIYIKTMNKYTTETVKYALETQLRHNS